MVTFVNVTSETLLKAEYEHDLSNLADSPNTVFIFVKIINLFQGLPEKRFYIKPLY